MKDFSSTETIFGLLLKKELFSLLLLGSCFIIGLSCQAQSVEYGFQFGMNLSNTSQDVIQSKIRTGFNAGLRIEFQISDRTGILITPSYSQKGSQMEFIINSTNTLYTSNLKLDYLDIPLLFKYTFGRNSIKYYPIGGFTLSYLVEAVQDFPDTQSGSVNSNTIDLLDEDQFRLYYPGSSLNRFIYGASIGFGVSFLTSEKFSLFVDSRYSFDFNSTIDTEQDSQDVKNRYVSITTGFLF